ncbi:hypothetical protein ACFT7S_27000 [Streptomyces sp. NPDC057136]|uniref:hypothetical protein n=1 Tax=Streptomyces sp. NPDC057136 TaxID=3346029 RepID=UPI003645C830
MVVLTAAVRVSSLALFLVGSAVSGAAVGTAFKGSVTTVLSPAVPERRGETLTGLFLAAYLGLSLPVLGLGLAVQSVRVPEAVLVFSGVLLAVTALIARRITRG